MSVAGHLLMFAPIGVMVALRRGGGRAEVWTAAVLAGLFSFAVEFGRWLKPGLQPIGMCGLLKRDKIRDVDLGYAFLPEFWSNGYARESAAAVLAIARRLRLTAVAAFVSPGNAPSIRLLDKLGFAPAGETKLEPAAAPVSVYRLQLRSPPGQPHGRAQGG